MLRVGDLVTVHDHGRLGTLSDGVVVSVVAERDVPGLPHTIYPALARRFRVAYRDHELVYSLHPGIWPALRSHVRWLQAMGRPVAAAAWT